MLEKRKHALKIDNWKLKRLKVNDEIVLKDIHEGEVSIDTVKTQTYLGENLEMNGSNSEDIKMKLAKGKGVMKDIFFILENIHLGKYFFHAMKMLRESLFVSVITHQSEVWFNVVEKERKDLETLDSMLLSQTLRTT